MMTPTPMDTQTRINDIYRRAIIALLSESNEPIDNSGMSMGILGGAQEAEVLRYIEEPYAPALVSLVANKTIACWHAKRDGSRGNKEYLLYDMYHRIDPEISNDAWEKAQEFVAETYTKEGGYNNPANWRAHPDEVIARVAKATADDEIKRLLGNLAELATAVNKPMKDDETTGNNEPDPTVH